MDSPPLISPFTQFKIQTPIVASTPLIIGSCAYLFSLKGYYIFWELYGYYLSDESGRSLAPFRHAAFHINAVVIQHS